MLKLSYDIFKADRLLSVKEVASLLHIDEGTARHLATSGEIPALRIGHLFRMKWSGVVAYLDRQAINAPVREVK